MFGDKNFSIYICAFHGLMVEWGGAFWRNPFFAFIF